MPSWSLHSSRRRKTLNKYTANQMVVGAMEKNKDGERGMGNVAQRGRELPFS